MPLKKDDWNDLCDDEVTFITELTEQLRCNGFDPTQLLINRTSEKVLNFRFTGCQIGRIKLQGQATKMQILTAEDVIWHENLTLEKFVDLIPQWIEYIKLLSIYDTSRPVYP